MTPLHISTVPLLLLLLFLTASTHTSNDVVSSLSDISQAIAASRDLASELTNYVVTEEGRLSKLRRLIARLEGAIELQQLNGSSLPNETFSTTAQDSAAANPISAFQVILKLASNWSKELSEVFGLQNNSVETPRTMVREFDSRQKLFLRLKWYADMLPSDDDVQGALDAILRLQQTYKIPAIDIAEGRILHSSPSPRLTDWQCMRLGLYAYEQDDYKHAIEWYNLVKDRLDFHKLNKEEITNSKITHAMVYDHLSYALGRAGRYKEALEATEKLLKEDPKSANGAMSKVFYEMELRRYDGADPPHIDDDEPEPEESEAAIFDNLCRQADEELPPSSKLTCRFSAPHPYFTLGPLKEEIVQEDPLIMLWHDFVSQNEVDRIIELAKPGLKRALVRNPESGALEPAPYRVTKNVWLADDLNDLTKRINNRIQMATGLNIDHGEELQVANYGLGGYYAPHFDYARRFELDAYDRTHGNRIATTMIYLTPVEMGGATAFTKTGAFVKPVARSLVFWYNLLRSGEGDLRSRHGACPVLVGSKWVMNKWIRAAGQEWIRPCALEPEPFNPEDEYKDI